VKRTLRDWKKWWEEHDRNDDAEIDQLFANAEIEDDWDTICEIDLIPTTKDGDIRLAEIRIFEPEEGEVLVKYEYKIPYELGQPELIDLIASVNQYDEFEEEN
jgi:hypothetical protein